MEELSSRGIDCCLAVDLRGHGLSPLGSPEDFGPAQLAADIRAALVKAGILHADRPRSRNVVLVCHSMGGRIGMRYAADFRDDVAALVIEDMDCHSFEYPADYFYPTPAELKRRQDFSRAFSSWDECRATLVSFDYTGGRVDGWLEEVPPRIFPRGPTGAVWSAINPHAQWLARHTVLSTGDAYAALQRLAALRASGDVSFPVHLLTASDQDTVCDRYAVQGGILDMRAVLPGLIVTEFPEATHSIHNWNTPAFVDLVEKVVAGAR